MFLYVLFDIFYTSKTSIRIFILFAFILDKSCYPHYFPQSYNKSITATPLTRNTMLFIKFLKKPLDNFSFANYIIIFDNKGKRRLAFCF